MYVLCFQFMKILLPATDCLDQGFISWFDHGCILETLNNWCRWSTVINNVKQLGAWLVILTTKCLDLYLIFLCKTRCVIKSWCEPTYGFHFIARHNLLILIKLGFAWIRDYLSPKLAPSPKINNPKLQRRICLGRIVLLPFCASMCNVRWFSRMGQWVWNTHIGMIMLLVLLSFIPYQRSNELHHCLKVLILLLSIL